MWYEKTPGYTPIIIPWEMDSYRPIRCRKDPGFHRIAGRHPRRALVFVSITPYCTLENRIDGVVITLSDITTANRLEAQLRADPGRDGKSRKKGFHEKDNNTSADAAELRRRAEARLRADRKKGAPSRTERDVQRLVQELQVHQIELEMQNEELRGSRAEVEAGLERFTDLYDFAPVGYMTLGRDGWSAR